jgi:hypothetical protein
MGEVSMSWSGSSSNGQWKKKKKKKGGKKERCARERVVENNQVSHRTWSQETKRRGAISRRIISATENQKRGSGQGTIVKPPKPHQWKTMT